MLFRRFCSHATSAVKIRDFKEMPCLSALQTFKFIKSQYNGTVMEVFTEFEQIYGGCYRSELPGLGNVLQLSDVGGIEQMFRQDHVDVPKRFVVPPWKRWRDESKKPYGLLITNSSDWKRMRSAINKNLSRPASAAMYTSDLSAITTEFVKFVEEKQESTETRGVLIQKLLFIWSLESISCVLYGQRLGAFNKNVNPTVNEFIEASSGILPATSEAVFLPTFLAKIFCKAHDDGWKTVFEIGERMVDEKLLQIQEEISSGLQPTGFLANMFANENISRDDIYGNVTDLMMAAVDTTTATMQWILCMLTENPAVEQKLYEEICNVVGNDQDITQEHLERMTYLKAIVKETLRLYPVTLVITKIASSEMVICGHRIPTGTLITCPVGVSGRDPDVFHDPDQFIPERWIGKQGKDINKFASLPFSFGARMCAGRRFAELQLYLLTTKFVQQFKLEMIGPPRKVKTAGLVVPTPDVKIVFNRRS